MKVRLKDVFVIGVLIIIFFFGEKAIIGNTAIDIQLHDTYFVFGWPEKVILTIAPSIFLFFFFRGLKNRFRSIQINLGLMIGLVLIELIIFKIIQIANAMGTNLEAIFIVWMLFVVCLICLFITSLRTFNIWRKINNH